MKLEKYLRLSQVLRWNRAGPKKIRHNFRIFLQFLTIFQIFFEGDRLLNQNRTSLIKQVSQRESDEIRHRQVGRSRKAKNCRMSFMDIIFFQNTQNNDSFISPKRHFAALYIRENRICSFVFLCHEYITGYKTSSFKK